MINGLLFWSNGCPHCETVLRYTLPPLQESYRNQLNIQMVELVTLEDVDEFFRHLHRLWAEKGKY